MNPPVEIIDQVQVAYRRMAKEARYRPAAPGDGLGNITGPLNLSREAKEYTRWWWEEEEDQRFNIGCCHHPYRPAMIFTIEAARLMCAGDFVRDGLIADLLKMALVVLEEKER